MHQWPNAHTKRPPRGPIIRAGSERVENQNKNHGVNSSATSAAPDMRKEMALGPYSYAYPMSNTGGDCVMACGFFFLFSFF